MNKYLISGIIVAAAAIIGYASYWYFGKDNAVEEACEQVIQKETGQTVDLSGKDEAKG